MLPAQSGANPSWNVVLDGGGGGGGDGDGAGGGGGDGDGGGACAELVTVTGTGLAVVTLPELSAARASTECAPAATPSEFHVKEYGALVSLPTF